MKKLLIVLSMFLLAACGPTSRPVVETPTPVSVPAPMIETIKVQFSGALIVDKNSNGFAEAGEGVAGEEIEIHVQGITVTKAIVLTDIEGMFESDTIEVSLLKGEILIFALAIPRLDSCDPVIQVTNTEIDGVDVYYIEIYLDDNCPVQKEGIESEIG